MKITVEVDDLWIEEGEVKEAMKGEIIGQVVQALRKELKESFDAEIKARASEFVQSVFQKECLALAEDVMKEVRIEKKPIREYMIDRFENGYGWNAPTEAIKKEADKIGEEMKKRYDMRFAALIIDKMNKGGFLKDGVADLLLTDEQPKQ